MGVKSGLSHDGRNRGWWLFKGGGYEEDVWVQDKAAERWRKLHSEKLHNL
jgi:hypothetical protein